MKAIGSVTAATLAVGLAGCSLALPNSHRESLLEMTGVANCPELEQISFETDCCQGITMDYTDTITFEASEQCLTNLRSGALTKGFERSENGVYRVNGPGSYDELSFDSATMTVEWRDTEI